MWQYIKFWSRYLPHNCICAVPFNLQAEKEYAHCSCFMWWRDFGDAFGMDFGRIWAPCCGHVGTIFADFCRFLDVFRGLGPFWERLVGLYRFVDDLPGFGSILGQFWGPMLEPVWKPRRLEIGKRLIFLLFFRACKRDAVFETILGRFL